MKRHTQAAALVLSSLLLWGCGSGLNRLPLPSGMALTPGVAAMGADGGDSPVDRAMAAADKGKWSGKFKLVTYNVKNLFDKPVTTPDGYTTPIKPDKERKALSEVIHDVNPHVMGLVEIESLPTLTKFRDDYLADMGYRHIVLIEGNDQRGIDVALISKFPVVNVKSHKDVTFAIPGVPGPSKFSRDVLQATVKAPNGYTFTVFVNHLKSQHGDDPADVRRKAEAGALRDIVRSFEQKNPKANYVVLGDLNDIPDSPTLTELVRHPQSPKLHDVLAPLAPKDYTYYPIKYRSRIDYLLLSQGMINEYVPNSAWIKKGTAAFQASDHLPAEIWIDGSKDL